MLSLSLSTSGIPNHGNDQNRRSTSRRISPTKHRLWSAWSIRKSESGSYFSSDSSHNTKVPFEICPNTRLSRSSTLCRSNVACTAIMRPGGCIKGSWRNNVASRTRLSPVVPGLCKPCVWASNPLKGRLHLEHCKKQSNDQISPKFGSFEEATEHCADCSHC